MPGQKTTQDPKVAEIVTKVRREEFIDTEELELLRQYYTIPDEHIFYPPRVRRHPKVKIVGETLRRLKR